MSDILDSIDDLIGDDDNFEEEEVLEGEIDYSTDLEAVLDSESSMTQSEARDITEAIRSAATATYILLAQAHEGKAFKALGYDTWAEYVREEFEISPQRSYQLLDLSKTIKTIEDSSPEGTTVKLTEAQARDIKRELPRITEKIKEETAELPPEEASSVIDDIIEEAREQKKADDKAIAEREKNIAEAEEDGYHRGLEAAADALLQADSPDNMTDSADDEFIEVDVEGDGGTISPSDSMNLYQFVNALTGISSLPEPDDFVATIPESRFDELYENVMESAAWINRLTTLMELRKS